MERLTELFGIRGIEYETAVLEAPNMLFELTSFSHNSAEMPSRMQAQGPGMTHTCFQSPASRSGYEKVRSSGSRRFESGV